MAVSGDRFRNAANRLQLRIWPLCVPAQSLRAFMSSIMRWRSGLTAIRTHRQLLSWMRLTTPRSSRQGDPARYRRSPPWLLRSWTSRTPQRAIAQRFSALAHSCLRTNATARPQLAKADTAFQAHPLASFQATPSPPSQARHRHHCAGTGGHRYPPSSVLMHGRAAPAPPSTAVEPAIDLTVDTPRRVEPAAQSCELRNWDTRRACGRIAAWRLAGRAGLLAESRACPRFRDATSSTARR